VQVLPLRFDVSFTKLSPVTLSSIQFKGFVGVVISTSASNVSSSKITLRKLSLTEFWNRDELERQLENESAGLEPDSDTLSSCSIITVPVKMVVRLLPANKFFPHVDYGVDPYFGLWTSCPAALALLRESASQLAAKTPPGGTVARAQDGLTCSCSGCKGLEEEFDDYDDFQKSQESFFQNVVRSFLFDSSVTL